MRAATVAVETSGLFICAQTKILELREASLLDALRDIAAEVEHGMVLAL